MATIESTVLSTPESLYEIGPAAWLLLIDGTLGRDDLNKLYQKNAPPQAPSSARLARHQVVGAIVGHALEQAKHDRLSALNAMSQMASKRSRTETKLLASLPSKEALDRLTTYGGMQFKKQRSRMIWAALNDARGEVSQAAQEMLLRILQAAQSGQTQIELPAQPKKEPSKAIPSLAGPQDSAKIGKLRRTLKEKNGQIEELRSTIVELQNQLAKDRGVDRRDREENQHQNALFSEQRAELVEVKKENQALKIQVEKLRSEHKETQARIDRLTRSKNELELDYQEQTHVLRSAHSKEQEAWQKERSALLNKEGHQTPQGVVVLFDAANLGAGARAAGGNLNFTTLLQRLVKGRSLRHAVAFAVAPEGEERRRFEDRLRQASIHVQWKAKQVFDDGTTKADWDVGLAVAAMQWAGRAETIIIASGDGDFLPLIGALEKQGTQVEVAGWPGRIHKAWNERANRLTLLDTQDLMR